MHKPKASIGYLYINGLNDGRTKWQDRLAAWWWRCKGVELRHAHVNWLDGQSLQGKLGDVAVLLDEMLEQFDGVTVIGTSAGGSLALNAFYRYSSKNICVVTAHARLGSGNYVQGHRNSMYRRAHMGTGRPSKAFVDSVARAETQTIPALSGAEKGRVLTLSSLTDMIVPPGLMTIEGVRNHRAFAFGHAGGYLAHLIADRDLIIQFAESSLMNES